MADENEPTPTNEPGDEGMRLAAEDTAKADAARPNINNLGRVDRDGRLIGAAFPYQVGEGAGITPEGDSGPVLTVSASKEDEDVDDKDAEKRADDDGMRRSDAKAPADNGDAKTRARQTPGEKR